MQYVSSPSLLLPTDRLLFYECDPTPVQEAKLTDSFEGGDDDELLQSAQTVIEAALTF